MLLLRFVLFSRQSVYSLEQAQLLAGHVFDTLKVKLRSHVQLDELEGRRHALVATIEEMSHEQQLLSNRVQCSLAGCLVSMGNLPEKMNPVVRPLMEGVKKEQNVQLQVSTRLSTSL